MSDHIGKFGVGGGGRVRGRGEWGGREYPQLGLLGYQELIPRCVDRVVLYFKNLGRKREG